MWQYTEYWQPQKLTEFLVELFLFFKLWSKHRIWNLLSFFFLNKFIYLFIYFGLCWVFVSAQGPSSCGERGPLFIAVRGPHCRDLSRCGAQAPDAQAQQLWLTGLATPRHAGSSRTRARTCVPCIGRRTPNHCATREAHEIYYL